MSTLSSSRWSFGSEPPPILPWQVKIRWATAAVAIGVVVLLAVFRGFDSPLRQLWGILFAAGIVNAAIAVRYGRGQGLHPMAAGAALLLDVVLLTALLEITGGPFNPFSAIFAVLVGSAFWRIGRAAAWMVGAASVAAMALLVYWHLRPEPGPGHHRLNDVPTHLFTMWMAGAMTAELAAYFVSRSSSALARRQRELDEMRARAARSERLASLTTLAAGAAHELSTPLGTIAVAARELERSASTLPPGLASAHAVLDDARLIRAEVDRCQAILDQMSGRAGGGAPDAAARVDPQRIAAQIQDRLTAEQAERLEIRAPPGPLPLELPEAGLVQAIASLVRNAFEAAAAPRPVQLEFRHDAGALRVVVRDAGAGLAPAVLARAGEPFYTTKETGRGLGLFLARVFAERFGGALTLHSEDGTTAELLFPAVAVRPADRQDDVRGSKT